jgi:hypothetical protein
MGRECIEAPIRLRGGDLRRSVPCRTSNLERRFKVKETKPIGPSKRSLRAALQATAQREEPTSAAAAASGAATPNKPRCRPEDQPCSPPLLKPPSRRSAIQSRFFIDK